LAGHRRENTPAEIVAKLNQAINAGLSDAEMKARLINRGGYIASSGSPADFSKLIADYTERWGKVIRAAHSVDRSRKPRGYSNSSVPTRCPR
jgi:tripartite-type tricarboxylate transporter receptor subunit TctC